MDFFDLLDKVIRGIVYFIYNVIETTATIIRHPIRGPLFLSRRHTDANVRQIGGLTFLFLLLIFLFQWLAAGMQDVLKETSFRLPGLELDIIWPAIVGAFVTTIIIDASVRLYLRYALPGRHQLRQLLLSMCEFAWLWLVLAVVGFWLVLSQINDIEDDPMGLAGFLATMFLGYIVLVASAYPTAIAVTGASMPLGHRISKAVVVGTMFEIAAIFPAAMFAGAAVFDQVQNTQRRSELSVETVRCMTLPDGRIAADGILQIGTSKLAVVEPDDLVLESGPNTDWPSSTALFDVEWRQQPDPQRLLIVEPGSTLLIETVTRRPVRAKPDTACRFDWDGDVKNRELEIWHSSNKLFHASAETRVRLKE